MKDAVRRIASRLRIGLVLALVSQALPLHADNVIVLGTTGPFSGPFSEFGEEYRKGQDACLSDINARGGVRGRPVRVEYMDDAYDPARTISNVREMVAKGVIGFVSLTGTGSVTALKPVLEELQVPVVGVSSGAIAVRDPKLAASPWVFHTKVSYSDEFAGFARMLPTLGISKVAFVYQDNPFGKAGLESARAAFARADAEVPTVKFGNGVDEVDSAVREAAQLKVQTLILIGAGASAAEFVARYQRAAPTPARIALISVIGGRSLTARLGEGVGGLMISLNYPNPWNTKSPIVRKYHAAIKMAQYEPSLLSMESCVNVRFMVEALQAAGDNPNRKTLYAALNRGVTMDEGDYLLKLAAGSHVASTYHTLGIYRRDGRIAQ